MDLKTFFENIEKILRFLLPAFVFFFLLKTLHPSIYQAHLQTLSWKEFLFYFPLCGLTIYSIHRTAFEVVDFFYFKSRNLKVSEEIETDFKNEKMRDFMSYKWATTHSALITSELGFICSIFYKGNGPKGLLILSFVLLGIISGFVYFGFHKVHKNLKDKRVSTNPV